ncbi:LysM peptidoglycan-binding domain-containing protein [Micromonospora sp. WMMC415]|uniref:BTAD domain-containing putative transcriptional regulator n=1 Tax=Micromonospora sp. WMMC415 TaxID=2675222 RepID=UPI0012B46C84|nr:BTAD domain-containing putative transcriptional regulator [Micromonospora sp. WMMC415]QGN49807.1 LysM peptidoglycan-binding domain-containing protein [Micromonospora sp. WMMC415]
MRSRASSVAALLGYGILIAAVPATLVHHIGLPDVDLPSTDAVRAIIQQPVTSGFILALTYAGACGIWALLVATAAVRGYHRLARALRWLPAVRLPGPLQHLAALMLGATAVTAAASAAPAHAAPDATNSDSTHHPPMRPAGPSTPTQPAAASAKNAPATYTVARGDTLSAIAQRCLGDDDRWPEIFALNRGTHFPDVGGTLRDPDLIYPGWTLDLPADATAPAKRPPRPTPPPTAQPLPPSTPSPATPPGAGPAATMTPHPSGAGAPTASQAGPGTASPPATATTADVSDSDTGRPSRPGVSLPSGSWVDVGLALAVAAAVALVWAHRQRRHSPRRPSTASRMDDPDLAPMPRVVGQIRRGLRRTADTRDTTGHDEHDTVHLGDQPVPTDPGLDPAGRVSDGAPTFAAGSDSAAGRPLAPAIGHPMLTVCPPAGLGLAGPGAHAAARGFLTAALAAGGEDHPDARTRVVIPSATAATLLGAGGTVPRTPRLTVTASLDDAVRALEEQAMHRTRLLHQHDADTITDLRATTSHPEPVPPVMLLADADAVDHHDHARVAAVLAQGHRLDIHGVLLGPWPPGDTVTVADDGTTTPADSGTRSGSHPAAIGRLTVLHPAETVDLLTTLAESHTGQPPTAAHIDSVVSAPSASGPSVGLPPRVVTPQPANLSPAETASTPATPNPTASGLGDNADRSHRDKDTDAADIDTPAGQHHSHGAEPDAAADAAHTGDTPDSNADLHPGRVEVSVLGAPGIVDPATPPPLRKKSVEVLVYLAVHDGIATVEAILDDLLPDAPASKAPGRLYTYVSDLRAAMRRTGGPGSYLTHPHRRYALNPETVDVDLWRMRAAIRDANQATDPQQRVAALRRAVDLYRGHLAEGADYEWIEPYREAVRQEALDAYLALADALASNPAEQLTVLDAAIRHNPYTEQLYQQAMRARAALGQADPIRALRRALTRALGDIDAEPSDDTITLADDLVAQTQRPRHRPQMQATPDDGAAA